MHKQIIYYILLGLFIVMPVVVSLFDLCKNKDTRLDQEDSHQEPPTTNQMVFRIRNLIILMLTQ